MTRLTVPKASLQRALTFVTRTIPERTSNPMLSAVRLAARDGTLDLSGTNLECDARASVACEMSFDFAPIEVALPAHLFADLVRGAAAGDLELTVKGTNLELRGGGGRVNLNISEEAPQPTFEHVGARVELRGTELLAALTKTRYAISAEGFQSVFRSLCVEFTQGGTTFIGTDGYRIASYTLSARAEHPRTLLVPGRGAKELEAFARDHDVIDVSWTPALLTVTAPGAALNIKLAEGDFPDWRKVLPKHDVAGAKVPAGELRAALARVSLLADKNANRRVEMTVGEGVVRLGATGDHGTATDALSAETTGNPIELAFNASYLAAALASVTGDAEFTFSGSTSPASVRDSADAALHAVLVPLRA